MCIRDRITTVHYLFLGQIHFAVSLVIACGSVLGARMGASLALSSRPEQLLIALGAAQIVICAAYVTLKLY